MNTYWNIVDTKEGTVFYTITEGWASFKMVAKKAGKVIFKTNDPDEATRFIENLKSAQ